MANEDRTYTRVLGLDLKVVFPNNSPGNIHAKRISAIRDEVFAAVEAAVEKQFPGAKGDITADVTWNYNWRNEHHEFQIGENGEDEGVL